MEKENVKKMKETGHTHTQIKKIIKVDLQKTKTVPWELVPFSLRGPE